MTAMTFASLLTLAFLAITILILSYFGILSLMIAFPVLQIHLFYLHRIKQTWFKDLNVPESFGFLHNQVTPFFVSTNDGEKLYAWHVLPVGIYRRHQDDLLAQPSGLTRDIASRLAFQLLRDDPDARLVIYLHGTAGTLASGYRTDCYRNLYSAAPNKIHILAADYRGYGYSNGLPSEKGLLIDAISLVDWAMQVAGVPPSRIVIFGQSLGSAVGISLSRHFSVLSPPVSFTGIVLVASFSDVASLMATYRIGGVIPVLSPLAYFPGLLAFFNGFLASTWLSKDRIAEFVRLNDGDSPERGKYHITLIHAEDDRVIPFTHTEVLFWHAINATSPLDKTREELEREKLTVKTDLGAGGSCVEWRTENGVIREEILKYGVHDKLMAYPAISSAVLRAFQATDPAFGV